MRSVIAIYPHTTKYSPFENAPSCAFLFFYQKMSFSVDLMEKINYNI